MAPLAGSSERPALCAWCDGSPVLPGPSSDSLALEFGDGSSSGDTRYTLFWIHLPEDAE